MDWQIDWHFGAQAFATAFTIVDPIGMIPITAATTAHFDVGKRNRIVDSAVIVAGIVMLVMGIVGRYLFDYLGITLPAFGIAGGILLLLIAIDMLFARPTGARATSEEEREAREVENPAVFPLAIPMLAGPGTIATVLLLVNLARGNPGRDAARRGRVRCRARHRVAVHARIGPLPLEAWDDRYPRHHAPFGYHTCGTSDSVHYQRPDSNAAVSSTKGDHCGRQRSVAG